MIVRCDLTNSDYRAFQRHILFRYRKIHWICGGLLVILLLASWFGGSPEETVANRITLLIGGLVVFGGALVSALLILRIVSRVSGGRFRGTLGEHEFNISEDGLTESNTDGKVQTRLSGIKSIDETSQYFFVITNTGMGHVIPKRDLQDSDALRVLQSRLP